MIKLPLFETSWMAQTPIGTFKVTNPDQKSLAGAMLATYGLDHTQALFVLAENNFCFQQASIPSDITKGFVTTSTRRGISKLNTIFLMRQIFEGELKDLVRAYEEC